MVLLNKRLFLSPRTRDEKLFLRNLKCSDGSDYSVFSPNILHEPSPRTGKAWPPLDYIM